MSVASRPQADARHTSILPFDQSNRIGNQPNYDNYRDGHRYYGNQIESQDGRTTAKRTSKI